MSDFQNNSSVALPGRVTGNRDLLTTNNLMKWAAQGKIFEAGQGLQTVAVDSQAESTLTPDDVKGTYALVAPSASSPLIIPIMLRVCWEVEGGAATDHQLVFTKQASDCVTTLALSGRDSVSIQNMNKGKAHTPTASALYGVATTFLVTVSALVDADNIMYDFTAHADNNLVSPLTGTSQQVQWNFWSNGAPHILSEGAAMIFYISSGTTDAGIHPYMQWAEVEEGDLV